MSASASIRLDLDEPLELSPAARVAQETVELARPTGPDARPHGRSRVRSVPWADALS